MRADASEDDLLTAVIDLALLHGFRVHHSRPARTAKGYRTPIQGHAGLPDLILVGHERVIFAELKGRRGQLTTEQAEWRTELERAVVSDDGAVIGYYVWRPADWDDIRMILTGWKVPA